MSFGLEKCRFQLELIFFNPLQVKVESIDDEEEMQIMDEAFDILGFTHEEKFDVYKCSSTCMVMSRYVQLLLYLAFSGVCRIFSGVGGGGRGVLGDST